MPMKLKFNSIKNQSIFQPEFQSFSANNVIGEYYGTAEPPVRCGESHPSGLTEPLHFVY